MRNSTRDSTYPQWHFFPDMLAMMENELPSRDGVVAMFENAGLRLSAYQRVLQLLATDWNEFADKQAMRADSFLARLPVAEFEAGMAALRAHARAYPHEAVIENIHFFVFGG
jgi:hypothetical protein